jgi:hypothetical protein
MFWNSVRVRWSGLFVLTGCVLVNNFATPILASEKPLKGAMRRVDDLQLIPLKLSPKGMLPCMLWADAEGSAILALDGDSGVLRRISFPDCIMRKEKDFERKFAWMSLSAEGLLLSQTDLEEIWVVDPVSLELRTQIAVPKLKRAASAMGLSVAVACDRDTIPTQKLYVVDLKEKTVVRWAVPRDPRIGREGLGLDNPAVSPDGAYVFTQHSENIYRFSLKDGKLRYEEASRPNLNPRIASGNTPLAGITISPDSKWVCLAGTSGTLEAPLNSTAIYPVDTFNKHQCVLEPIKYESSAMGFDLRGGFLYAQTPSRELSIFTLTGIKKKEYNFFSFPSISLDRRGRQFVNGYETETVRQYLVHPKGNLVVMLTLQSVYVVEVPRKR